jgi:hypothetical protein
MGKGVQARRTFTSGFFQHISLFFPAGIVTRQECHPNEGSSSTYRQSRNESLCTWPSANALTNVDSHLATMKVVGECAEDTKSAVGRSCCFPISKVAKRSWPSFEVEALGPSRAPASPLALTYVCQRATARASGSHLYRQHHLAFKSLYGQARP